jgi:Uma2 family endonuclease
MSFLSLEEYLHTSYENPDPEYVDGKLLARGLSDNEHSSMHARVGGLFWDLAKTRPFYGLMSLRSRVSPTRVRVPDLSLYAECEPNGPVPSLPPLVVVEIVSDDPFSELMEKLADHERWGVQHIWLVVPPLQELYVYRQEKLSETLVFEIPEYDVRLTATDIFG